MHPAATPDLWDCVIVGGGPAGLSAAVYMGRFRRKTLVIDNADGRWTYGQRNDNYLGFPRGISARHLVARGRAQAARFNVQFASATVHAVHRDNTGLYRLNHNDGDTLARTVIWAAGVTDRWPAFPGARRLVGQHLFWCIVCDGWRTLDESVLLLGHTRAAAQTALQFLTYTPRLTLLVDPALDELTRYDRRRLTSCGVRVRHGRVRRVQAGDARVEDVELEDGTHLDAGILFSLLGSTPRTGALAGLGVALAQNGHVRIDDKNRTNLEGFCAAGDVTNKHSHQVVSAAHEGAQAAQAANFTLYGPKQKLEPGTVMTPAVAAPERR